MDVRLAPMHTYTLNPSLDFEAAKQQAIDKRLGLVASGVGSLFSRPKPEEVDLVYAEIRYEAFWHAVCTVRYVYERNKDFMVPVTGVEVRKVTILGQEFEIAAESSAPASTGGFLQQIGQQIGLSGAARSFTVSGVEYCVDENRQERYLEAVSGQPIPLGADYAQKDKTEVTDLTPLTSGEALIVPPQMSASHILKSILGSMLKQIQADKVLEEATNIETLDLYFRPVYAFEFAWKPKNKTGVAEFDAVTGSLISGKAIHTKSEMPITQAGLFDLNAETITSLFPTTANNVKLVE
jgi:hypothetical protein